MLAPDRRLLDPVTAIGSLIAGMCLRESAFLDELLRTRNPRPFDVVTKRQHRQFMRELIGYYSCVIEDYLEGELPDSMSRFMDLVAHETARCATYRDRFLDRPPYFIADQIDVRQKRYVERINSSREKLKLMPPHLKEEWLAARTALELRWIIRNESDDPNELLRLEVVLFERLTWTACELVGRTVRHGV